MQNSTLLTILLFPSSITQPTQSLTFPHTSTRNDSLMMNGRNNGKKQMAVRIVAHAFEIVNLLTDQNPIQVLVDAIVNTGPREDSTRIGSQGTVRRQAVDVSPLRRVNQAIALITIGVSPLSLFQLHLMMLNSDSSITGPRVLVPQRQVHLRVP